MIMLMLVIDIYIIMYFPTIYQTLSNTKYTILLLLIPSIYGLFTWTYGFLQLNNDMLQFCNPPVALPPKVSRFWSLSNVIFNTITLLLFVILMIIFHLQGKRQKKNTTKLMNRLKVSVIIFTLSWYMCTLGVDIITALDLDEELFGFLQANMIFFALLCYTQPFYVVLWRSVEYRDAFFELWSCFEFCKRARSKKVSATIAIGYTSTGFTR
ncbi:unnamed protein product [Caenorhabditis angaria]|uniref:G-protein coupled receptors family 1 profile domain-containing protein n=1 Tax=Caenorhabditis angaria TaxID=860376 RepID=A0A9P1N8G8_9PELO|nr:unnamed protein product [Caenorhabditis angaria]